MFTMKFLSVALMAITPSQMREPDVRPFIQEAGISFNETTVEMEPVVRSDGFHHSTKSLAGFKTAITAAKFNETAIAGSDFNSTVEIEDETALLSSFSPVENVLDQESTTHSFADFKNAVTSAAMDFGNELSVKFQNFQVHVQDLSYAMVYSIIELYAFTLDAWCPGSTDYLQDLWEAIATKSLQLLQDVKEFITEL